MFHLESIALTILNVIIEIYASILFKLVLLIILFSNPSQFQIQQSHSLSYLDKTQAQMMEYQQGFT